jgi:hypothetical protein
MRNLLRAALSALALAVNAAASAQSSVDNAHAIVNRLLDGAGDVLVFESGRTLETAHATISDARTAGRCLTTYATTKPNHPDVPESYRGQHDTSGEVQWDHVTDTRVEGDHFFYDHPRVRTGRQFTYHFQLPSAAAAAEFANAAAVIIDACRSGEDDGPPAEEVVLDPRGNTASLAIDRRDGTRYGWAVDYQTVDSADRRALGECGRDGSKCHVVLRFTGGCGAYAADTARGSTAYGWGTARTRADAESRAHSEARNRGATNVVTRVWGCNSVKQGSASATQTPSAAQEARAERERQFQEALRKHDEAVRANEAAVEEYRKQLEATRSALESAAQRGQAAQADYEAELAKARAVQEQYERQRQAYREEYKKATGRYPDE